MITSVSTWLMEIWLVSNGDKESNHFRIGNDRSMCGKTCTTTKKAIVFSSLQQIMEMQTKYINGTRRKKPTREIATINISFSTSHSLNPVPFCLVDPQKEWSLKGEQGTKLGGLAQIGGTILELCGLEVPSHYLPSLVQKQSLKYRYVFDSLLTGHKEPKKIHCL